MCLGQEKKTSVEEMPKLFFTQANVLKRAWDSAQAEGVAGCVFHVGVVRVVAWQPAGCVTHGALDAHKAFTRGSSRLGGFSAATRWLLGVFIN